MTYNVAIEEKYEEDFLKIMETLKEMGMVVSIDTENGQIDAIGATITSEEADWIASEIEAMVQQLIANEGRNNHLEGKALLDKIVEDAEDLDGQGRLIPQKELDKIMAKWREKRLAK